MNRTVLTCAILGCTAVLLGAFGAHGLEGKVSEKALAAWATANRYHFIHTLSFLILAVGEGRGLARTGAAKLLWALGLVFFSGGLYVYAVSGLKIFALIAPIGGLSFAAGWLALTRLEVRD
ncbi:MAG TPA: DUF423 domain-containing protein [Phycisphaerales bacterium]|nr:DUF423 domain-containing protein [Phycisphaerales bacterium]